MWYNYSLECVSTKLVSTKRNTQFYRYGDGYIIIPFSSDLLNHSMNLFPESWVMITSPEHMKKRTTMSLAFLTEVGVAGDPFLG